jgi:phosphoribosylformylglycinamidine (FGAM) synthase PurS component
VTQVWRLTVTAVDTDPREQATLAAAHLGGFAEITELRTSDLYFVAGDLTDADRQQIHTLLVDPLLSTGTWDLPTDPAIEISLLPGVADRTAQTLFDASQILHLPVIATATGRRVGVTSRADTDVGGEHAHYLPPGCSRIR